MHAAVGPNRAVVVLVIARAQSRPGDVAFGLGAVRRRDPRKNSAKLKSMEAGKPKRTLQRSSAARFPVAKLSRHQPISGRFQPSRSSSSLLRSFGALPLTAKEQIVRLRQADFDERLVHEVERRDLTQMRDGPRKAVRFDGDGARHVLRRKAASTPPAA